MKNLYAIAGAVVLAGVMSGCSVLEKRDVIRSYGPVDFRMSKKSNEKFVDLYEVVGKNVAVLTSKEDDPSTVELTAGEKGTLLNEADFRDKKRDRGIEESVVEDMLYEAENTLLDDVTAQQMSRNSSPVLSLLKSNQNSDSKK